MQGQQDLHPFLSITGELLAVLDQSGIILQLSTLWEEELRLPPGTLRGREFCDLLAADDRHAAQRILEDTTVSENRFTARLEAVPPGGRRRVEWSMRREANRVYLAGHLESDALREKELLLQEILHRTKNNLSTIVSVLDLQISTLRDPLAIDALKDAKGRVQSMLLLYENLILPEQIREISISYYLAPLAHDIVDLFPPSKNVMVETEIEEFSLSAKQLSSVGFIVTELITNAMKHAFSGRDDGIVTVSARLEGREAVVVVRDNGKGIPDAAAPGGKGKLGYTLVYSLAEELGGTIRVRENKGTEVELRFPRATP
ncbi:MAG: sensor histidine kinase [Alkalispirochaetaceae bacterium]